MRLAGRTLFGLLSRVSTVGAQLTGGALSKPLLVSALSIALPFANEFLIGG
jgi:hypothetical protein